MANSTNNSAPLGPEKFDQNFLGKHWGGGPCCSEAKAGGGGSTKSTKNNKFFKVIIKLFHCPIHK
ncbi:MAG: hypothetical protein IKM94_00870, partial [Alphaproteobacteria bacterium]|nr:hypothetical protein [Alphaproteobacteria bacterium]